MIQGKMMQPWNYDVEAARDHYESLSEDNVEAACIRDADDRGRRMQSVLRGRLGDDGWHLDFSDGIGLVVCPSDVKVYAWRPWPFPPSTRAPVAQETAVEKYHKLPVVVFSMPKAIRSVRRHLRVLLILLQLY